MIHVPVDLLDEEIRHVTVGFDDPAEVVVQHLVAQRGHRVLLILIVDVDRCSPHLA